MVQLSSFLVAALVVVPSIAIPIVQTEEEQWTRDFETNNIDMREPEPIAPLLLAGKALSALNIAGTVGS